MITAIYRGGTGFVAPPTWAPDRTDWPDRCRPIPSKLLAAGMPVVYRTRDCSTSCRFRAVISSHQANKHDNNIQYIKGESPKAGDSQTIEREIGVKGLVTLKGEYWRAEGPRTIECSIGLRGFVTSRGRYGRTEGSRTIECEIELRGSVTSRERY